MRIRLGLAWLAATFLAGCSGSARVTVENRLDEPVHVVINPCGGKFVATKGLDETILPGAAVTGRLRVSVSPPFISYMEVECAGLQVSTGASGPWWTGDLINQARYEVRVLPGPAQPTVQQRLDSYGLTGWRLVPLERLDMPWHSWLPENRRIPAKPSDPLPD